MCRGQILRTKWSLEPVFGSERIPHWLPYLSIPCNKKKLLLIPSFRTIPKSRMRLREAKRDKRLVRSSVRRCSETYIPQSPPVRYTYSSLLPSCATRKKLPPRYHTRQLHSYSYQKKMKTLLPLLSILLLILLLVLPSSTTPIAHPRTAKTTHKTTGHQNHCTFPSSSYKKNRTNPRQHYAPQSRSSSAGPWACAVLLNAGRGALRNNESGNLL